MMKQNIQSADYYKSFLLSIYSCQVPFDLFIIDKKPKTKMGVYIQREKGYNRIRIYSKWICDCPLEKIAIHEYAHHIHHTEKGGIFGRGKERAHGELFWRIYSALMAQAIKEGIFCDNLISEIIKQ